MQPREALERAREAAHLRRLVFLQHAQQRMRERNVRAHDVRSAIETSGEPMWRDDEQTWRFEGRDVDGDDLAVALAIDGTNVRVVTVF